LWERVGCAFPTILSQLQLLIFFQFSLRTGDIFVCGTCGGVGQGTHTFISVGDVMETEVEGLGKMRNKFVAEA